MTSVFDQGGYKCAPSHRIKRIIPFHLRRHCRPTFASFEQNRAEVRP
jgi:hypothetical protein